MGSFRNSLHMSVRFVTPMTVFSGFLCLWSSDSVWCFSWVFGLNIEKSTPWVEYVRILDWGWYVDIGFAGSLHFDVGCKSNASCQPMRWINLWSIEVLCLYNGHILELILRTVCLYFSWPLCIVFCLSCGDTPALRDSVEFGKSLIN